MMQHQGTKRLATPRLILRPFTVDDADAMYRNWANDPKVTEFMTWPAHDSVQVSRDVLADWTQHDGEQDYYHWAITVKALGGEPIGSMGVVHKNDQVGLAHIGYCIGRAWWRQGITSESLAAVINYLFTEVGFNRIEARHDPRNANSGKVMQKCGMRFEGTLREADWSNQGLCDASYYAILRREYIVNQLDYDKKE